MTTLALAGDTMLGRGVGKAMRSSPPGSLFAPEIADMTRSADLFLLNLECCISDGGRPSRAPGRPFFFRAPPEAVGALVHLGVDCVTLANNHALDYGCDALLDTFEHLASAGIPSVGAGPDVDAARRAVRLTASGVSLDVFGVTDHPSDFAAAADRPGVALAPLEREVPEWLLHAVRESDADNVLVTPHWGPNMVAEPRARVRRAADALVEAGATLIAGHSAHVFHGVRRRVLFDLGDFIDDYAVDPVLRNDLGLLFFVTLERGAPRRLEALPLKLDYCHTRVATGDDERWAAERFRGACAALGTEVEHAYGRLVVEDIG